MRNNKKRLFELMYGDKILNEEMSFRTPDGSKVNFEHGFNHAKQLLMDDAKDILGVDDYGNKIIIRYTCSEPGVGTLAALIFYKTPEQRKAIIDMVKDTGLKIHNEPNPYRKEYLIKI